MGRLPRFSKPAENHGFSRCRASVTSLTPGFEKAAKRLKSTRPAVPVRRHAKRSNSCDRLRIDRPVYVWELRGASQVRGTPSCDWSGRFVLDLGG
jgi:hypothetical protein